MTEAIRDSTSTADREMTATRLLDAPRELVWEVWTDPPDGTDYQNKMRYLEVVKPERLVYKHTGEAGNPVRHPASPTWPLEVLSTLTLTDQGGKTTLTLTGVPINATEAERKTSEDGRSSMQQGFSGTWDQLDAYLAKAGRR